MPPRAWPWPPVRSVGAEGRLLLLEMERGEWPPLVLPGPGAKPWWWLEAESMSPDTVRGTTWLPAVGAVSSSVDQSEASVGGAEGG